jgi:hypothetical protein
MRGRKMCIGVPGADDALKPAPVRSAFVSNPVTYLPAISC